MKPSYQFVKKINDLIYSWLTVTVLILGLSEALWNGLVNAYLNLGAWLLFWSVSATLKLILFNNGKRQ